LEATVALPDTSVPDPPPVTAEVMSAIAPPSPLPASPPSALAAHPVRVKTHNANIFVIKNFLLTVFS